MTSEWVTVVLQVGGVRFSSTLVSAVFVLTAVHTSVLNMSVLGEREELLKQHLKGPE